MILFFFLPLMLSCTICAASILTQKYHIHKTAKGHTTSSKQRAHSVPTPRIGGLGLIGFIVAGVSITADETSQLIIILCVSALPVFIGGLGEDIGFDVKPKKRLLLSFLAAFIAGVMLDVWVTRTGLPGLDTLLSVSIFSVIFTILISGGISHAYNLIDGLNGLSLGIALMMSIAFACMANVVEDTPLLIISLLLCGALAGILVFNFPFGKIFLGDAGAYTIGHLLTWISFLFLARHPEIAPFALFLMFFWPVADMLFAILRRWKNGKRIDQPDRMHFHQFIMRAIELVLIGRRREISNPLAAMMIWPLAAVPIFLGILFYDSNALAAIAWLICFLSFIRIYVTGIRIIQFLSKSKRADESIYETMSRMGFGNVRNAAIGKSV